jgi:hypothetical protein
VNFDDQIFVLHKALLGVADGSGDCSVYPLFRARRHWYYLTANISLYIE